MPGTVSTELLRRRFDDALTAELKRCDRYQAMKRDARGAFKHRINSRMKAIVGKPRNEWSPLNYEMAADWLLMEEAIDLRWALAPVQEAG